MAEPSIANDDASPANQHGSKAKPFQIELTLVELSETVKDDSSGKDIPNQVDQVIQKFSCHEALTYLAGTPLDDTNDTATTTTTSPNRPGHKMRQWLGQRQQKKADKEAQKQQQAVHDRIKKQVTRFIKVPDKYIAWGSILLKSQAFHQVHHPSKSTATKDNNNEHYHHRPIMELPRTQYKKPYIPSTVKYDAFPEVNLYPISISHQYPFVGLARLVVPTTDTTGDTIEPQHRPLVGLDIVTFDDYNPRLYNSAQAFVRVFQSSFTEWEWNCLEDTSHMLFEFYLRWAIKEAYTKALGVGMGLAFDSFETHLTGITTEDQDGIYSWLLEQLASSGSSTNHNNNRNLNQEAFLARGSVVLNPGLETKKSEGCTFYFLPLWEEGAEMKGCACICLAQAQSSNSNNNAEGASILHFDLATKWQGLEEVIEWHDGNATSSAMVA